MSIRGRKFVASRRYPVQPAVPCDLNRTQPVSPMSTGSVRLVNAVFYAHHGVMQEEHRIGGRYEVDASMDLDFEAAARTDDLAQTVDYEAVYGLVRRIVTKNRFYLIEKLAYLIGEELLQTYPFLVAVEVVVRKPNPPVGGTCDRAEAVYRRRREDKGEGPSL